MIFTCSVCGGEHDFGDVSYYAAEPDPWQFLADDERESSFLDDDMCVMATRQGTYRFVRACLNISIRGQDLAVTWGVWCSVSAAAFSEMEKHWDDPSRVHLGPYPCHLATRVAEYGDTLFLKAHLHSRAPGLRPLVQLEKADHPLAQHQHLGVPENVMRRLYELILHDRSEVDAGPGAG